MDELLEFYKRDLPNYGFVCDDKIDGINVTQLDVTGEIESIVLSNAEVEPWLNHRPMTQAPDSPCQIRFVWVDSIDPAEVDYSRVSPHPYMAGISTSNLNLVLANFKLERAYRYCATIQTGYATFQADDEDGSDGTKSYCIFYGSLVRMIWTHDSVTSTILGVILAEPWTRSMLKDMISHRKSFVTHPMALPYMLVDADILAIRDTFHDIDEVITEVENRTGHLWRSILPKCGKMAKGSYLDMSASMSGCATRLAGAARASKSGQEFLNFASRQLPVIDLKYVPLPPIVNIFPIIKSIAYWR